MTDEQWQLWLHEFWHAVYGEVFRQQRNTGVTYDAYLDEDGVWKIK